MHHEIAMNHTVGVKGPACASERLSSFSSEFGNVNLSCTEMQIVALAVSLQRGAIFLSDARAVLRDGAVRGAEKN